MKKSLFSFLLSFALMLGIQTTNKAQTTLSPGDLVIVAINGDLDAPNSFDRGFSFMPLVNLDAGTVIYFTDYGWSDLTSAFITNTGIADAFIYYTAPTSISAGTIIRCDSYTHNNFTYDFSYSGVGSNPYLNTSGLSQSDELLIFQGSRAAPTFIFAASFVSTTMVAVGWATGVSNNGTDGAGAGSALPPGLTDDVTALSFNQPATGNDNSSYSGVQTSATKAQWQARISNFSNWTFNDAAPIPTPPTGPFILSLPLTATQSQVNLLCNSFCSGSATVVASGGVSPYTYSWSPSGGAGATASSLCAGSYTCTITDNVLSSITKTFNITQPSAITLNANSQTNVSCFGGSNGAASVVSATGGTPGYTYNWTPGNPTGDGTVSVTGLTATTWTCTTTDANSCTATRTFTITSPSAIIVTAASQINVSCNGGGNGAASINTPTGGAGGFTYNWSPGNPAGDGTVSVTGLTTGSWTCTTTDANSCTATQTFNITQPTAISVTPLSQTNISCFGGSNGAAAINTPTGGAGGYTYDWTPGTPTGDGTVSVTGLTATTWTCTVTDANSCTKTQTFNVTQPTAISVTAATQTNISCFGGSNGAAAVNAATGGAGGYTYNWTPGDPTGDGTVSVTGLTAGTWTCTVQDANSCTATQTFNVTQPTALSVTAASQTNIACFGGSNGAAAINPPTGGAGGYTYNWTPGNPTGDGTVSVTGLTAGTWTCTVQDANSCTATQTFNVTQPTALSVSPASQTNIACNGGSNGAASVSVSGGTTAYIYNWTPGNPTGEGTSSVTGITAGTWTCTVEDANSCTATQTFNITQPAALVVSPLSQTNISCNGGSNGAASVSVSGGTTAYIYNWTPGNPTGEGTSSVTGLTAGTWTCTVEDANSCTATQTFNITQPAALVVSPLSQTNISCNGGSNGAAAINTPTGGAGGYIYNWTPGNPTGDGTTSVTGLTAGTWTCTVEDANSCTATQTFTITEPTALSITIASQTEVSCNGGSNGEASVNAATGGAGGYGYDWTPGTPAGDGTLSVTGLTAGSWTCTVQDANSCTTTQTFTISEPPVLSLTMASQTAVSIFGGSDGAASVNAATGGTAGYTYDWTPGDPTGDGSTSVTGLTAGSWTCTVQDANSCTAFVEFTISQPPCLVNIPDANFKAALLLLPGLDVNTNGQIECTEAAAFTGQIDVDSRFISDLTGIKSFTSATTLKCGHNSLTSLDLSGLTSLNYIDCNHNDLASLDVSSNTNLGLLYCYSNNISSLNLTGLLSLYNLDCSNNSLLALNVSSNTDLVYLYCGDNLISSIDISSLIYLEDFGCESNGLENLNVLSNTELVYLYCSDNLLTTINVSGLTSLEELEVQNNQLTDLDISTNTALGYLYCYDNLLTDLDVSANTGLYELQCYNNHLTSLNVKNGNNTNIYGFNATNNPGLSCIQVDDPAYSYANWTDIDGMESFSADCSVSSSVSISALPGTTVCTGTIVTYTASPANGGTAPTYQWIRNGHNISGATNSTYTTTVTALSDGKTITCIMTAIEPYTNGSPATSNPLTMTVIDLPVSVSIAANPGTTVCTGTSVTYSATPTNGGTTPTFQWIRNGANIAGATNSTYTCNITPLSDGKTITCVMASNETCTSTPVVTSNPLTMTVTNLPVSVSIDASPGTTVCPGTSVTFSATPTNGGATPTYQWIRNGANIAGATNSTYTSNITALSNGKTITCVMTSSETCTATPVVTSNPLTMDVIIVPVSVSIDATPGTTVCPGTSVTLSATPTNGGTAPTFQWVRNGTNISGATNSTYTFNATMLSNGKAITCVMTSNETCATGIQATSNSLMMTVQYDPTSVSIVASPGTSVVAGTMVTYTATPTNGGLTPTYQWIRNGSNIAGATNSTYTCKATLLSDGKVITCVMTSSETCTAPVTSNPLTMAVTPVPGKEVNPELSDDLIIYPNPTDSRITLDYTGYQDGDNNELLIYSIDGKLIMSATQNNQTTEIDVDSYDAGVYYIKLQSRDGVMIRKFIKE